MNSLYPMPVPTERVHDTRIGLALLEKGYKLANAYFYTGLHDTFEFVRTPELVEDLHRLTEEVENIIDPDDNWNTVNAIVEAIHPIGGPEAARDMIVNVCDVGALMAYREMSVDQKRAYLTADAEQRAEMIRAAYKRK